MSYQTEYDRSMNDPEGFWRKQAEALEWFKFPQQILTRDADGIGYWFADGEMNTAYMALDHHVKSGRGNQLALIYDSPVTNTKAKYTYAELTDEVARTAGMLTNLGVVKGDRVIIYMPMIPQAVIAMLAVARLGAIHSVVFGGFAPPELALRIDDAKPKVILTASCGIEIKRVVEYKPLVDKAFDLAKHKPQSCVIFQRPQATATLVAGRDFDWTSLLAKAQAGRLHTGQGQRSAVHPLHLRHHRKTQGCGARQRRPCSGVQVQHESNLQRRCGRCVLGIVRRGLGGRSLLHRVWPAAAWLHHRSVRRQTDHDAGCRCAVACLCRIWREGIVHRTDRVPRREEGRPAGLADEELRHEQTADHLLRRRTPRSADRSLAHR